MGEKREREMGKRQNINYCEILQTPRRVPVHSFTHPKHMWVRNPSEDRQRREAKLEKRESGHDGLGCDRREESTSSPRSSLSLSARCIQLYVWSVRNFLIGNCVLRCSPWKCAGKVEWALLFFCVWRLLYQHIVSVHQTCAYLIGSTRNKNDSNIKKAITCSLIITAKAGSQFLSDRVDVVVGSLWEHQKKKCAMWRFATSFSLRCYHSLSRFTHICDE